MGEKSQPSRQQKVASFQEMLDEIKAKEASEIQRIQESLAKRKRLPKEEKARFEERVREHQAKVDALVKRRSRFDAVQGNRKIPAHLREMIADVEMEVVQLEQSPSYSSGSLLRPRKKHLSELYEQVEHHLAPPQSFATTNSNFHVAQEYSRTSISRAYDGHVWEVLKGHFERTPGPNGKQTKVRIAAALPEKSEYLEHKRRHFTKRLGDLLAAAYDGIAKLQAEMESAFDNTPEGLRDSAIGEARAEAAERLEAVAENLPELPEAFAAIKLTHYPSTARKTRSERAADAADMLRQVAEAIRQHVEASKTLKSPDRKKASEVCDQLDVDVKEIEEIEFPGMFG